MRDRSETALPASDAQEHFLLQLDDRLRPLADAEQIQSEAARALGEHLGASRVGYAEISADDATSLVTRNCTDGVRGIEGPCRAEDYSPTLLPALRAGRIVVRADVAGDQTLSLAEKGAHHSLQIGATVDVPLVKAGRLVAVLFMHHRHAHRWTPEELALLQVVATRTWEAVERARAEAALRESEARLRLALEVAELGTWTWNLDTGTGDLDTRGAEIVGIAPGDLTSVAEAQLASIHPADLAAVQAAIALGVADGRSFDRLPRSISRRRDSPRGVTRARRR
ncbi:MAG: GAF domain-containing protein [Gemmatimonadota bacterium]|nr:GAF domain-containing protein [Gemmatimonadota bacterium]